MKRTIAAIVIIVVGILLYFVFAPSSTPAKGDGPVARKEEKLMSKTEIVTLVRQQSRLYSVEQSAHKTIILSTAERDSISTMLGTLRWNRPWSKSHIEIPLNVTYKAYVDMSKIGDNDITLNSDSSITITLPDPTIELTSCEINHDKEVYDKQIFASQKSQEFINRHVANGVKSVWREIDRQSKERLLRNAKDNANVIIADALVKSGYKKVNIQYKKNMNIDGLTFDTGTIHISL